MAFNLPLIVRIDNTNEENKLVVGIEFVVGQTTEEMEHAGGANLLYGMQLVHYEPFNTKKINSFHIAKNGKITRMAPGETTLIGKDESVGWGYEEPLISISQGNIRIRYW